MSAMSGKLLPDQRLAALGQRFRELRRQQHWTQSDLAARAGVSRDTVHRLEHGAVVDVSSLTALLAAMGHQLAFVETPRLSAAGMRQRFAHIHEEGD
jgi:transcriptional regulator with XRE-family HTH domain